MGDYLFSNKDFISQLSTENRNVFRKVWDEIKYLCKVATAGSKEARELARIEKMFREVYRGVRRSEKHHPGGWCEVFYQPND